MRSRNLCALFVILLVSGAHAAPEVIGTVHPVTEPDMVAWFKERAAAEFTPERIARLQAEQREATRKYAEHPPGASVPRTTVPATHWFDPSIAIPYDLRDHEGRLIHPAGTVINPLEWRPLTRRLLFFDADDKDQVRWAEAIATKDEWRVKPIIVAGAPLDIGRKWQREVSFDQRGLLVEKLGIKQVPAIVRQDGNRLRIDEVLP
ncbi:hypothetical protein [Sulfurivermis fontis]|uniref:hypothetical protein n=1 Tax=Sulfurivermis fontis TaxID=1972068 RepID=UPI00155917CC|nr:hypothetical protein [Sulfurivermis fontis]